MSDTRQAPQPEDPIEIQLRDVEADSSREASPPGCPPNGSELQSATPPLVSQMPRCVLESWLRAPSMSAVRGGLTELAIVI
jgi:hypothetical protein